MFTRNRLLINELFKDPDSYLDKDINVCGWIENFRVQKNNGISFINLNDGSGIESLQIIIDPKSPDDLENYDSIYTDGTKGVSIKVYGTVITSPAKGQSIELKCKSLKILGRVNASEYPISKKKLTLEYLRKYPHLRARTKTIASVARVRNICSIATHEYFQSIKCKYVHTPIITSNDCEGAGETFDISNKLNDSELFFGNNVNLTVSGQLHGETYATALSDIYTFGPTFRAENSNTPRHLAEFWMIEPEMCFIDFKDLIDVAEDYIKFTINKCLVECKDEITFFNTNYQSDLLSSLQDIASKPFVRMTYKEVVAKINQDITDGKAIIRNEKLYDPKKFKKLSKDKHIFEGPETDDGLLPYDYDLDSEHEKYMTNKVINGVLVVTNFPAKIKSFYMKENKDDTVHAMDILVPNIGELVGGSMREEDYDILKNKMEKLSISIPWYLDTRKYGTVPHGGFGLGFERLIMLMCGIYNIKDIIPYPRYPKHCCN